MSRYRDAHITVFWLFVAALATGVAIYMVRQRYELAKPELLFLLLPLWIAAIVHLFRSGSRAPVRLPTLHALTDRFRDPLIALRPLPYSASLLGASLLCLAMARPQSKDSWQDVEREGIDIVITLDVSTSMLARDLKPDRLEASKKVAIEFIDARPNDRIGLVLYEGEAFTQCPITTDHRVLKDLFMKATSGRIEGGTAVGMGLATAINRLRESESKSKVIILLTDGVNNAGTIQPLDAAQIAAQLGMRVYSIGVGTIGRALSPVDRFHGQLRFDYVDVEIDEEMLQQVADLTGGRYFRATDELRLKEIYEEIDRMEKTRVKVTEHSMRSEEFFPIVMAGGSLLLLGFLLERSLLRSMI